MGKKDFENAGEPWDPQANQDQVTDADARVSQNGDLHSSAADDKDRDG
ncbi:hypothetical protein [Streptomyces rectiverticillatus]|nr:hypothetical protein [Streptomyces rectiverticillatus]